MEPRREIEASRYNQEKKMNIDNLVNSEETHLSMSERACITPKGEELIQHYKDMAKNGYKTVSGKFIPSEQTYGSFELAKFRNLVRPYIGGPNIKTVLDYGCGASNWDQRGFDGVTGQSAREYFDLEHVTCFDPARTTDTRNPSDCVVCIDVLEHLFLADVPTIIRELFSLADKMLVVNVACYDAGALLPNGENAHTTKRDPNWWLGLFESISVEYPEIEVILFCSDTHKSGTLYPTFKSASWEKSDSFIVDCAPKTFGNSPSNNVEISPLQCFGLVEQLVRKHPDFIPKIDAILKSEKIATPGSQLGV